MLSLRNILAMSSPLRLATIATITAILFAQPSLQQTYSSCDPLSQSCPADPALGRSISVDFTSGASSEFTSEGNPTYNSNGAAFTVSQGGDAPQIVSNWYIMFGKYELTMKAAPGAGIVSSAVLQSDDLDEIDWEWLGAQNDQVQSNYFGKGQTTTYDRAATHQVSDTQNEWHTYTVEWTQEQIVWQIDGTTVRVLTAEDADPGQYPQTPCQLKIGSWSGGDPSNPQGTIQWAQGPTDYSQGPFTMYVQSLSVVDYSTGSEYTYGDESGSWSSIESKGGKINGNAGGSVSDTPSPAVTAASSGSPAPFYNGGSGSASATVSATTYPGLPSGWSVNSQTGKVIPPSSAPSMSQSVLPASQPAASSAPPCSGSGYKVVTTFNQRGFKVIETVPVGIKTTFNDKGFPVTVYPANCQASSVPDKADEILKLATLTDGAFTTKATAQPSPLTPGLSLLKQAKQPKQSDSSTVNVRCFAAFSTMLAAIGFVLFLA